MKPKPILLSKPQLDLAVRLGVREDDDGFHEAGPAEADSPGVSVHSGFEADFAFAPPSEFVPIHHAWHGLDAAALAGPPALAAWHGAGVHSLPQFTASPATPAIAHTAPLHALHLGAGFAFPGSLQFSPAASAPPPPPPEMISGTQIAALKDGLDATLTSVANNLVAQVFAETLPVLGNNLAALANSGATQLTYVTTLKNTIDGALAALTGAGSYAEAQVELALNSALAGFGTADLNLSDLNNITLSFATSKNLGSLSVPIEGNIGLPGLGFSTTGSVQSTLGYTLNFSSGLDATGFYLNTAGAPVFNITATTTLPGFSASAELGFLEFDAVDSTAAPSSFPATFAITLKDPSGEGRLRSDELGGDVLDATLSGNAAINLRLTSNLGTAVLPKIGTTLGLGWQFGSSLINPGDNNAAFGSPPTVRFSDTTLDLGTFFRQFAGPVLDKITEYTAPLKPIIDIFTHEIGLLDDLGFEKTTLLDFMNLEPAQVGVIKGLADIITLAQLAKDFTSGLPIDLGSLNVSGDLRSATAFDSTLSPHRTPTSPSDQNEYVEDFLDVANNLVGGGLSFPLLENFRNVGALFLGQPADLFEYAPAPLHFGDGFNEFFRVLGPFGVRLRGDIGFDAALAFGFDTKGLTDFATSGDADDVLNGFFIRAFDENGNPRTYVSIIAELGAAVELNVVVASAGVEGNLSANVTFPFAFSLADAQGKIRPSTLVETPVGEWFAPTGEFSAGLRAYYSVFGIGDTFDSPRHVFYSAPGQAGATPVLAFHQSNDVVVLHSGPRAALRQHGNLNDVGENFQVSDDDGVFEVRAFNSTTRVDGGPLLLGSGGDFSDRLETTADFSTPVVFIGGPGGDVLISGEGDDVLQGDDGNDKLVGRAGDDTLSGGAHDDILVGGPGSDDLFGGDGFDIVSYEDSESAISIDLRTNTISGDGAGDSFSGIEGVIGTPFNDIIEGSEGNDALLGGLEGDDVINGNGGNDVLEDGKGEDTLDGGSGDDLILNRLDTDRDVLSGGTGIDTLSFFFADLSGPAFVDLAGGSAGGDDISGFENVIGSQLRFDADNNPIPAGDILKGDGGANVIWGLGGGDFIEGRDGDDELWGDQPGAGPNAFPGSDKDTLIGGMGNDSLYGQSDDDILLGNQNDDLLDGGEGDDYLDASTGNDSLYGGDGNDTLYGGAGNDLSDGGNGNDILLDLGDNNRLYGRDGNDSLRTGGGDDILDGGPGNDTLEAGEGNNQLYGGSGDDTLTALSGNDVLLGHEGNDTVHAGGGNDFVNGGSGGDLLDGGADIDTVSYFGSPAAVSVSLFAGTGSGGWAQGDVISGFEILEGTDVAGAGDTLEGDAAGNEIRGLAGSDTLRGLDGYDLLLGGDGNDFLDGGSGADRLDGGNDNDLLSVGSLRGPTQDPERLDRLNGGAGFDTITADFSNQTAPFVAFAGQTNSVQFADGAEALDFENIHDLFTGSGDDVLHLDGAADDAFDNLLKTGAGNDVVFSSAGNDNVDAGDGDDFVNGGNGGDLLAGGAGVDTLSYFGSFSPVAVSLFSGAAGGGWAIGDVFSGFENLEGSDVTFSGDFLEGSAGDNMIRGFAGSDTLRGLAGNDLLLGEDGDDSLDAGIGSDRVEGGNGDDFLSVGSLRGPTQDSERLDHLLGGAGFDTITADFSNQTAPFVAFAGQTNSVQFADGAEALDFENVHDLFTGSGDDVLHLDGAADDAFDNLLKTGAGSDVVFSGAGNDNVDAGDGDNLVDGGAGADLLVSGSGADQIDAGSENDIVSSGAGNDIVFGADGDDSLDAGIGSDRVDGGNGNDFLTVGALRGAVQDAERLDHLFGGAGFDTITADFSNQTIAMIVTAGQTQSLVFADGAEARDFENVHDFFTGSGNDVLTLDTAADDHFANLLKTGAGNDVVYSGKASDDVDAGDGDDFVNGGENDVVLVLGSFGTVVGFTGPGETLTGGLGIDTLSFAELFKPTGNGPNFGTHFGVYVDLATNQTNGSARGVTISGFENLIGTNYGDELFGNDGPNVFNPLHGGGTTTIAVTAGPDRIDGRGGLDTVFRDFSLEDLPTSSGITSNAGSGIYSTGYNRQTPGSAVWFNDGFSTIGVEQFHIIGASKNDQITGGIFGFNDILSGLGGNDTLGGNGGADTLLGGDGNDVLSAQGTVSVGYDDMAGGHDVFDGGAGDDLVEDIAIAFGSNLPSLGADALFQLEGGTGFDTLSADFSNQAVPIIWDSAAPTNMEFADGAFARNFEALRFFASGSGNDVITQGGRVENRFYLGAGNDTINPGLGVDTVNGGAGFDVAILNFSVGDTAELTGVQGGGNPDGGVYYRSLVTNLGNRPDYVFLLNFERVQVTGTSKNDNLSGTYGDDMLTGGAGDDIINGSGGNNTLDGGDGNDSLTGVTGNNTMIGGPGNDLLTGGTGNEIMSGDTGNDTILAGLGSDSITGGAGNDLITANDFPSGAGYGVDVFDAGDGDDVVADGYFSGSDRSDATAASRLKLEGGAGFDKLSADFGNETEAIVFTGGVGNSHDFADGSYFRNFEALVNFTSGSGNDTFALPGRLDHFLNARAGNDIVNPGLGIDTVNGGDGSDLLILDYSAGDDANVGGVVLGGSTLVRRDINTNAIIDSVSYSGFERAQFTGGSKADALTGFSGDNYLDGGDGNDLLTGGTGTGNDTMIGGAGNDTFIPYNGSDTITGGAGNDTITANEFTNGLGYGVDLFDAGDGDDIVADGYFPGTGNSYATAATRLKLDGGAGTDTLHADYGNQTEAIVFTGGATNSHDFADGSYFRNFEALANFTSGAGNDTIIQPGRVDNIIAGGAGNDSINPGLGIDNVDGGAGIDLIIVDWSLNDGANVSGVMFEGSYARRRDLNTNAIIDSIITSGFERVDVTGGSKGDMLGGADLADIYHGNAGNDIINGYGGDDLVDVGRGNDTADGGSGSDLLQLDWRALHRVQRGNWHRHADDFGCGGLQGHVFQLRALRPARLGTR